jgi:hypothetical protein
MGDGSWKNLSPKLGLDVHEAAIAVAGKRDDVCMHGTIANTPTALPDGIGEQAGKLRLGAPPLPRSKAVWPGDPAAAECGRARLRGGPAGMPRCAGTRWSTGQWRFPVPLTSGEPDL